MGKPSSIKSRPASLTKGKELGRGAYGAVYQGKLGARPVAIKKIHDLLRTDGDPQLDHIVAQVRREYEILRAVKHQHLVECIDLFSEGKDALLVMELMDQTLETYLSANQGLPVAKQLEICLKLANGLQFLHQQDPQILHRDLNANNVLLNKDGNIIKISDFGQAKFRPSGKKFLSTRQPGCVVYMPPESLCAEPRFNNKGDVFSLGVLMLQIATQASPSCGYYGIGVEKEVERRAADLALLPKDHVHILKPLILQCLRDDLKARPDAFSIYFCLSLMLPEASDMHKQCRPLEECCQNGNMEQLLQALGLAEELHLPVNLNQQNGDSGDTVLHIAAAGGHADCVRMLLDKGADCFVNNDEGATALHVASDDRVLSCLLSAATLKAVQNDSTEMFNIVCEFPRDLFEAENLQQALDMAVEMDSALNVARLAKIAHILPNISKALTRAKEIHAYGAYTVQLMLQAAYADDSQLVLALFGEETITIPLISDPDFPHIQSVLRNGDFPVSIICEVAEELRRRAFCTAVEECNWITSHRTGYRYGNAKFLGSPYPTRQNWHQKTPLDPVEPSTKTSVNRSQAIIKAVEANSAQLNELLAVPKKSLEPKCLQTALMVAVEKNSAVNAGKIIIKGRESLNINAALTHAMEVKSHAMRALLLLVKAAYEDDVNLVATLYGASIPNYSIPLICDPDLCSIQLAIQEKRVTTAVPIEIARREKRMGVREELLLRTDVNMAEGTVLWNGLRLTELEVSWLRRIHWVRELQLAQNDFQTLPPQMGNYLKQVTRINLQFNSLRQIPHCLLELPCIRDLNLSYNKLLEIPEVHEWATPLAVLDLSHNELQSLPQYCEAPDLKCLNISHNKFQEVPECICYFTNLTTLELDHNAGIVKLPKEMGRLQKLTTLKGLDDIHDPPKRNRVNAKECITYLNQKLRNTQVYYRMKLILCGKAETGKTTLVARLLNQRKNVKEGSYQPTVGIDVSEWQIRPKTGKKTFTFRVWDFGGQEEYYATLQCFLTERSLYLLVWNITHGEEGVRELKPWLDTIALRAPNSKVIIVATFYDKVSKADLIDGGKVDQLLQQVRQLAQSYQKNFQVRHITCVALHGKLLQNLDNLKRLICEEAESYTIKGEKVMGRLIPASYNALDFHLAQIQKEVCEDKRSPIMYVREFRRIISSHNLTDIHTAEEVKAATLFLHEVGSLLHYDDRKNNLDDLYFVDPPWLCDMMSTVVTMAERSPFITNCIVTQAELLLPLYNNERIPSEFFDQYLVLLERFEIALSLDQAKQRILIPSMLPDVRPDGIGRPTDQVCHERQILFPVPTPPGFWSRLLARVMHTILCIQDLIESAHGNLAYKVSESNPHLATQRCTWSAPSGTKATMTRATSPRNLHLLEYANPLPQGRERRLESGTTSEDAQQHGDEARPSLSLPKVATSASLPVMKAGDAVFKYWRSGFNYCDPELYFLMEDIKKKDGVSEVHGVQIVVTPGREGCKVNGQLFDLVSNLVEEWYPGLLGSQTTEQGLEQRSVCYQCLTKGSPDPHVFSKESLVQYITECKANVPCPKGHEVALVDLVPDLVLADIDKSFLLEEAKVVFETGDCHRLGQGGFGSVFHGRCRKQSVAVKTFQAQNRSDPLDALNQLRIEAQVLQRNHHPSLVCMVGMLIFPLPCLVMEEAPLGSLDGPLMKHRTSIARLVLFKLASQIAAALSFLHSNSFIYRDLKAANVLLWSLDMDDIVNCKLADFGTTIQSDPMGVKGTRGTPGFIAPEVAYMGGNRSHATYDFKADIFSYAMVLYQIVTRHNPYYDIKPINITSYIEQGRRPCLVDFPVIHTGFHFLTGLMKRCWKHSPTDRPTTVEILAQLAKPSVKLMMGVHPIASDYSLRTACCYISKPSLQHAVPAAPTDRLDPPNVELWLCCDSDKGVEITVYQADNMAILRQNMIKDNHVRCMAVCGDYIWVASRAGLEFGQLDIFSASTRQPVCCKRMKNTAVSCITCSDSHIYIGTMEGYIFMYELTLSAIQSNDIPTRCCITEHCINGLIISPTSLWVSHTHKLLFCDQTNLETLSSTVLPDDIPGNVGHLTLSSSKSLVWSVHLGGHILCAWQTLQQTVKFTIDVEPALLKMEPDTQPNDCIITALCSALDTVWCGMITGHILVFSEEQDFLLHFRPYQDHVRFLLPIASFGPCSSEECTVVSGGKEYIKNVYLEDVSDDVCESDTSKKQKEDSPKGSGTVIVLEALRACHMHQVRILGRGDTWASHDNVRRCEQEWEESKRNREQTQSLESPSCPSKVAETATSSQFAPSSCTSTSDVQAEQGCDSASTEDRISVFLPDGQEHIVVCQKPVLLKKLQEGVCAQGSISGSVSLFWRSEGGTVELSTQDQLAKYLALQDRPPIFAELDKLN